MYNPDTDLLFPPRVIPALRDLRGAAWQELVTETVNAGPDSFEEMGFVLMMARLSNCSTCNSDSYRAMSGCPTCAKQALKRCRESDEVLVEIYRAARLEVENYLEKENR